MRTGDFVIYKNQKAKIIETKWGLYCIRFLETHKQIWVNKDTIKRYDF
jgi:hypothetical protein